MPTPSSGSISVSDINVEVTAPSTTTRTFSALNDLLKPAQRPATPNMQAFYSKRWYLKNNDGNCNNGNCNCGTNCGVFDCNQCIASQCVNCVNCDTQNWLQSDCNCACTYNCNAINCYTVDCDCACDCACR